MSQSQVSPAYCRETHLHQSTAEVHHMEKHLNKQNTFIYINRSNEPPSRCLERSEEAFTVHGTPEHGVS